MKIILQDSSYLTDRATNEMISIFGGKAFDTPKPVGLIYDLLDVVTKDGDLVLDAFAGSGTTAHAVLKLNKEDGGNRKFILVEMMDYAESITAERVKRVISGYGEGSKAVEGTGGSFGYYELGAPLMIGGNLNEELSVDKIREYVWYTETRGMGNGNRELGMGNVDDPYLLGVANDTVYYFCYEKSKAVTLDRTLLKKLKTKAGRYVIYADICLLDEAELERFRITFKKIPRDIVRL
jgi:adenine-specific DNA-methyltransferase